METHIMQGNDYDAFLAERRDIPGGNRYLALDASGSICWVTEADDAIHFARRSDAERMVDDAPDEWDIHVCDHRWMGGVPRDRVVPFPTPPRFLQVIERGDQPSIYDAVQFNGDNCEQVSQIEKDPHSGKQIVWQDDTTLGGWIRTYGCDDLPADWFSNKEDALFNADWREFSRGDWIIKDNDGDLQIASAKNFERWYEPWEPK